MCPVPLQESVNLKPNNFMCGVHSTSVWLGDDLMTLSVPTFLLCCYNCIFHAEEGIPGLSFLDLSKEDWKDYGLSRAGVIAVVKIQERIKAAQIEASTSPHISGKVSLVTSQ